MKNVTLHMIVVRDSYILKGMKCEAGSIGITEMACQWGPLEIKLSKVKWLTGDILRKMVSYDFSHNEPNGIWKSL